jgi:hypothetical protein
MCKKLTKYRVTVIIGERKQEDIYNAYNPDHACELAVKHLKAIYPLVKKKRIVKVTIVNH